MPHKHKLNNLLSQVAGQSKWSLNLKKTAFNFALLVARNILHKYCKNTKKNTKIMLYILCAIFIALDAWVWIMRMLLNEYLYFKLNELSFSYVYAPLAALKALNKQGNSKGGVANRKRGEWQRERERKGERETAREGAVIGRASARVWAELKWCSHYCQKLLLLVWRCCCCPRAHLLLLIKERKSK